MPKIIELTVEISIQKVSCPGVWLCQDGRVCLTVFALGTSYQTCLLPPIFPLMFKDVFYFKKRFQQTCALNNICCFLKDETIYCELIQTEDCKSDRSVILAQFLGAMNDVLFPPNVCTNDTVDLLMRRTKLFPGILSPKIEIATKIRIDEVWHQSSQKSSCVKLQPSPCFCTPRDEGPRQKQVCHSAKYHKVNCTRRPTSGSRSRSGSRTRSRSGSAESYSSCKPSKMDCDPTCYYPNTPPWQRSRSGSGRSRPRHCREYCVYHVNTYPLRGASPRRNSDHYYCSDDDLIRCSTNDYVSEITEPSKGVSNEDTMKRTILESRYIDHDRFSDKLTKSKPKKCYKSSISPCVCEICKRYHELFHKGSPDGKSIQKGQCIYRRQ